MKEIFDGSLDLAAMKVSSGIATIVSEKEGWAQLKPVLSKLQSAALLFPSEPYIKGIGMYTNPSRQVLLQRMKAVRPKLELVDIRPEVSALRVVKQPVEVAAIQRAVDVTCDAFNNAMSNSYTYEYELEAAMEYQFRKNGLNGHAYHSIVAGGINACTLHYEKNAARFDHSQLVLVDAGSQEGYYAADITRTWLMGKYTPRQRAVIDAVNDSLEFGLEQLKPGVSFWDCEQKVRSFVGKELQKLGLITSQDEDAIHKFYPHAPHFLGLDVHDSGDYHQPLEAGMVLTLEPGIYIPEESIGVRIEEDIVITATGYKVLSAACPRKAF
jgi:Xaa-Pro aminopeptidase